MVQTTLRATLQAGVDMREMLAKPPPAPLTSPSPQYQAMFTEVVREVERGYESQITALYAQTATLAGALGMEIDMSEPVTITEKLTRISAVLEMATTHAKTDTAGVNEALAKAETLAGILEPPPPPAPVTA